MGQQRRRPAIRAIAATLLPALLIAACGTSTAATTSGGAGGNPAGVAAARAVAQQYASRPTRIPVTQPIGKPVPAGKRVDFILCGVQSCQDLANFFTAGAKTLGWTVRQITTNGTEQSVQAAWNQAVRDHPDAVVASGFPRSVFSTQLAQLKAMNIPVVESSTADVPGDGISMLIAGPQADETNGKIMASWVTTDGNGSADTVYFNLPTYSILQPILDGFSRNYRQWCAGCGLDTVNVPITAIGKDLPDTVVSYLRSHPQVNHVVFALGLMNVGVPAALAAAGLAGRVHVVVNVGDAENYSYISAGRSQAAVAFDNQLSAWTQVDALARFFTGGSMSADQNATLPLMLVTKDNLVSTQADFPLVADFQAQVKQLWGV